MKIVRTITIENPLGLHARPAAIFVQAASQFSSEIQVVREDIRVSGKSIMGIMMLAAEQGAEIIVEVEGEDAQECIEALSAILSADLEKDGQ